MAGRSRYICCNLIPNSSTPIDSFQSQSLFGSVNVGSAGIALLLPISSFSRLKSLLWLVWLPLSPFYLAGHPSSSHLSPPPPTSHLAGPTGWLPPPTLPSPSPGVNGRLTLSPLLLWLWTTDRGGGWGWQIVGA